ncbi:hypothetical protein PIIN_11194 [Serendipita indica DSM 11827]|uniref:Uncharacterized protein n=1 Tax=Serendipita indica (strain DSM 11827) TaxID=1109443 RepID=G4U0W9_SERID|nr:hypothetical protein PIIN_11194 [Serendipita indica DSM 11827]
MVGQHLTLTLTPAEHHLGRGGWVDEFSAFWGPRYARAVGSGLALMLVGGAFRLRLLPPPPAPPFFDFIFRLLFLELPFLARSRSMARPSGLQPVSTVQMQKRIASQMEMISPALHHNNPRPATQISPKVDVAARQLPENNPGMDMRRSTPTSMLVWTIRTSSTSHYVFPTM